MSDAAPAPPAGQRLYWVDWMRFLAAACVLIDHAREANWSGPAVSVAAGSRLFLGWLVAPLHLGREAVVVFFALSGALVGGLTFRKVRAGRFDAANYAADRLARIYLPLLPALLLTAALVRALDAPADAVQYLGCLFGWQGVWTHQPPANGVLWTLAYELWFYVLAGCVAVVATRRERRPTAWLAAAGGLLALWVLCFRLKWIYLVCWLVGAVGFAWRDGIARLGHRRVTAAGLLLIVVGVAGHRPDLLAPVPALRSLAEWPWLWRAANLALATGTALFIVGASRLPPTTRAGERVERAGTRLAAFSYTLYLTHFPILWVLLRTTAPLPEVVTLHSLLRLGLWVLVCVAAAVVMHVLFEAQTPRLREWLRGRLGGTWRGNTAPAADATVFSAPGV